MKKIVLISFIIMVLAQWAAPLSLVWKSEQVFSKGKVFRFQTEPVDPEDPLRGRYVSLNFKADQYKQKKNDSVHYHDDMYAVIAADSKGYAYIKSLHQSPPVMPYTSLPRKIQPQCQGPDINNEGAYFTIICLSQQYGYQEYIGREFHGTYA